ncbi:MAG TPA: ATP-binding protein, partial [Polyangiales bacterium]|nr:ATP-binding protein [Polyangiales bacterium]
ARPASAAEVLQRLAAIDGAGLVEEEHAARAYLATPTLVGRSEQLARVRRKLERTLRRGRSNSVLVSGPGGVGRSRFLDACLLEATLLGVSVVRTDADDAASGEWGVVRALTRQLLTILPQTALEAAQPQLGVLGRLLPELALGEPQRGSLPDPTLEDGMLPRAQLQAALQSWLTALCRRRSLLIAVDDFGRIDEPSAALLSLLAHDAVDGLCLLVSVESEAPTRVPAAQRLLAEASAEVQLRNLTPAESEQLLRSLFGDALNLPQLAHRLNALAAGNPRDLLGLAQHLVDHGVLEYEAGSWTLPAHIDDSNLPSSMAQALRVRLGLLTQPALELALACALCPDQAFTFEECELLAERKAANLLSELDSALSGQILRCADDRYGLARPIWNGPLRALLTPERERVLHRRLAQLFERRGSDFRAGQHWLRAGEPSRGLDVLVAHARASQHQTTKGAEALYRYAAALPDDWFETFERALALCATLQRPARDAFTLRSRLAGLVPAFAVPDRGNGDALLAQVVRDSGLSDYHELPDSMPPDERIRRAIALAEERYWRTPERERVLPPSEAIALFARTITAASGRITVGMDIPYLRSLPDLRPFEPVSPALALLGQLFLGLEARYTGRLERACEIYSAVIERAAQPDRAGMEASYNELMRLGLMNALDMMEACLGLARREWGARVASAPAYYVNSVATRALHELFQGDVRAADLSKRQVERLRIEMRQLYDASPLAWEIVAHAIAEDVTRLRQALPQVERLAQRFTGWRAVQHYAQAEYHRIRRDPARAAQEIEAALAGAAPGEHMLWSYMAASQLRALCDLGRGREALPLAEAQLVHARQAELGCTAEPLWQALALCQAHLGLRVAAQTAEESIQRTLARGVTGLNLGIAYETRARVALLLQDGSGFDQHAELCYEAYGCYRNPALLAKYRRLRQEGERRLPVPKSERPGAAEQFVTRTGIPLTTALDQCRGTAERARMALGMLVGEAGAGGGHLFGLGVEQAECLATVGELGPPESLLARVTDYLLAQAHDTPTTSSDAQASDADWLDPQGRRYRAVLLCHEAAGSWVVMGVALLALRETGEYRPPAQMASAISRYLADNGASALLAVDET